MNQPLNKKCPICGGYIYLSTARSEICSNCGYVIPQSTCVTTPTDDSCNTTGVAYKYCQKCNTRMVKNGNWYECPNCHYGHMDYLGDPLDISELYIKSDSARTTLGRFDSDLMPHILQIDTNLIKFRHKEMELEFELEPDKLKNIDTIILNGYKYVKEKLE